MGYFIRAKKKSVFELELNNQPISSLRFLSWLSSNAVAELSDGTYQFKKSSFWKGHYDIIKEGSPIGKISFNWRGHMLLQLIDDLELVPSNLEIDAKTEKENYITYTMEAKGVFKKKYELFENNNHQPLITLHPRSSLLKVNYEVTLHHPEVIPLSEETIIAIMTFGVLLIRMRQTAGTG